MVSKIIHCCWFGGPKTRLAEACLASWRKYAPGWTIREWDEAGIEGLVDELKMPGREFFRAAVRAKKWAMASDWARMAVLFAQGGVYLDLDSEFVAPIDRLPAGEWVAGEWTANGGVWMNPGGGIALEEGSPVAKAMLEAYEKLPFDPMREMMPWINERLARQDLRVLDPEVMSPIGMDGKCRATERTVAVHRYAMSWASPKQRILQWLSWHGMRPLVDGLLRLKRAFRGRPAEKKKRRVMASVWEEHCCECAMPACFGTCGMFERGWHGRCVRIDDFAESVLGTGKMRFRRWAKIEAMWHGAFVAESRASTIGRINRRLRLVFRLLGPIHRAIRWRVVALLGRRGEPGIWRIRVRSVRDERLVASIATEDGYELFRASLDLPAGCERAFEFAVPRIGNRTLFRIFPADGEATGEIEILENAVMPGIAHERFVKCLVWDLDGTLWNGTLSEVGAEGCVPRPESVALVKALDARGIVNSVASRNDAEAAMAALRRFGLEEYFVFPHVGWGAKSDAIRALAREMNVSTGAIAFVDDRGEQRAEVAANVPGVRTYSAEDVGALSGLDEFNPPTSPESPMRRQRYREEMARRAALAENFGGDGEAFAAASGFAFEFLPVEGEAAARCLELLNRTNQLNISGRRYDGESFAALLSSCDAKAVHAHDMYGDYGTVGFVAMKGRRIVEMCFSCRAAKKGLERKVLTALAEGGRLEADAIRTGRNAEIIAILEEFA